MSIRNYLLRERELGGVKTRWQREEVGVSSGDPVGESNESLRVLWVGGWAESGVCNTQDRRRKGARTVGKEASCFRIVGESSGQALHQVSS